jgi:hypothetical protein
MDSSFEMFNHSSYIPLYPYPFSVSSEISSCRSNINNNNITTNDYYPTNPPGIFFSYSFIFFDKIDLF